MRILGIDPGLQVSGYACLESEFGDIKLIEAGVFRIAPKQAMEVRLNQIAEDIEAVLVKYQPQIVAVEELYSHYAHPKTAILMAHARGVILQKCCQQEIRVKGFSATKIKKSLTGNGRATKQQMQKSVQLVLSLPKLPEPHDVADAIAAALCCASHNRALEMEMKK